MLPIVRSKRREARCKCVSGSARSSAEGTTLRIEVGASRTAAKGGAIGGSRQSEALWLPKWLRSKQLRGTIDHLQDFHLDVDYSINGDNKKMCHYEGSTGDGKLGEYGDYMCDAPQSLVMYALKEAKRLFPNPDLIIWTGDNIPHIDNYDWDYVNNVLNITTEALFSEFPNVTILPTFGNHDYSPANAFDKSSVLYEKGWELWEKQINATEKDRFLLGGYYKHHLGNTSILMLNTNLYYKPNKAYDNFTNKEDPADQFAFMETELKAASKCRKNPSPKCSSTVHIVAHIAPGVFERTPNFTWFRDPYNEKFLKLVVDYSDVIGMMIFGHHHTDTFHLVKDDSGKAVGFLLMSPAVTPWFSSLEGAGANNPAFRVYDVDYNGTFNDIFTYYINLTELNNNRTTPFTLEYSFKKEYGIAGPIDLNAMVTLVEQMKTNNTVFQKYINFNSVLWDPKMPVDSYRAGQLCSLEFADYPRYYSCLNQENSSRLRDGFYAIAIALLTSLYLEFLL
ncbi:hypothetical protein RB195_012862 [Necator americanus]|uniref:Ser/Thr phosphatase family protein n=1 Tax=Necator americanus TaxID=51031 RepID=A0ABR1DSW6_NECAM